MGRARGKGLSAIFVLGWVIRTVVGSRSKLDLLPYTLVRILSRYTMSKHLIQFSIMGKFEIIN